MQKSLKIPINVQIQYSNNILQIQGPLGKTQLQLSTDIFIKINKNFLLISTKKNKKKSFLNLFYALIKQKIKGVNQGFKKKIYLKGIGFKFEINQNFLTLKLGYSHLIIIEIPIEIKLIVTKSIYLILSSFDYQKLTQFISFIKKKKKIDSYKGKGILYQNEIIKLKEGKKKKN